MELRGRGCGRFAEECFRAAVSIISSNVTIGMVSPDEESSKGFESGVNSWLIRLGHDPKSFSGRISYISAS